MDNINNEIKIKYLDSILIEDSDTNNQSDEFTSSILELYDNHDGGAGALAKLAAGKLSRQTSKRLLNQVKPVAKQSGNVLKKEVERESRQLARDLKRKVTYEAKQKMKESTENIRNTLIQNNIDETYNDFKQNIINLINDRIEYNTVKHSQTKDKQIGKEIGLLKKDLKCLQTPTPKKGGGYSELSETAVNNNLNHINDELNQLFSLLKY